MVLMSTHRSIQHPDVHITVCDHVWFPMKNVLLVISTEGDTIISVVRVVLTSDLSCVFFCKEISIILLYVVRVPVSVFQDLHSHIQ